MAAVELVRQIYLVAVQVPGPNKVVPIIIKETILTLFSLEILVIQDHEAMHSVSLRCLPVLELSSPWP